MTQIIARKAFNIKYLLMQIYHSCITWKTWPRVQSSARITFNWRIIIPPNFTCYFSNHRTEPFLLFQWIKIKRNCWSKVVLFSSFLGQQEKKRNNEALSLPLFAANINTCIRNKVSLFIVLRDKYGLVNDQIFHKILWENLWYIYR